MSIFTADDIKTLTTCEQGPTLSIFFPTHHAGAEIQQNPIRLKSLLKRAESQLAANGNPAGNTHKLLAPAEKLLEDTAFWRHQQEGLAIFRSRDVFRVYRTPLPLEEHVSVSNRFYLKPLIPLLFNDAKFYLLALSHKAVRLLECSRYDAQEVELPDVPQGVQEGLPIGPAPELQKYTLPVGVHQGIRLHGHGVGIDDADVVNLARYFQNVDHGLKTILKDQNIPLILACVEYLAPIFKEITTYSHIAEMIVPGNPDEVQNKELQRKAWPIVEGELKQARSMAAAQYYEGITKGRAADALAEVLPAAYQGRVATLFIPVGVHRWGGFNFETLSVEEHEEKHPDDDELLDLAVMQTFTHRGIVYGVPPKEIPGQKLLAAVFRYPLETSH